MLSQPEPACLVIADITGYTSYLAGVELDHAQDILADLVDTVVGGLRPPFRLAKLEGDAAFTYAMTATVDGSALMDTIERTYFAFRRRLRDIGQASVCDCNACIRMPNLDLKFLAHHGTVGRQRFAGREELVGSPVIAAHRLLKNAVTEQTGIAAYVLYTEDCLRAAGIDDPARALGLIEHRETYDHLGEIVGWVADLGAAWLADLERTRVAVEPDNAMLTLSFDLPAPPAIAWEYLTSPARRPRWQAGVNAVIEPLSIDGPAVTIRKFKKGGITPEKYIEWGSMTRPMVDFLKICVENGLNVVVSGGTGSGKTSLLNMISNYIPSHERVVTVEDAAELQMMQEHVVRLETRPANMEGTGAVTIRDLVRNALRMRPDRIVVGETRDGAAMDMLQAMNTGHDGSMTTTHANSPRECLGRLETLCLMSGLDLPMKAIREQIASAVNLIVQIQRLSDGSRKITSITEVCGMQGETVTLQEIFRFKETGFDKNRKIQGVFQSSGMIPTFLEELEQKGVIVPRDMFSNDPKVTASGQTKDAAKSVPAMPGNMTNLMKKTGTGGSKI